MANVERQLVQNPTRELPKGEVVFSKKLTFEELLKIEMKPENKTKRIRLLTVTPFNFEIRDLGNSLLHVASFPQDLPFSSTDLWMLLLSAKPGGRDRKNEQYIYGILDDWRIILPEVREKDPRARKLYEYHRRYVPEFLEFEANHFDLFWKVMQSEDRVFSENSGLDYQIAQLIDEKEFFNKYGRGADFSDKLVAYRLAVNESRKAYETFLNKKGFSRSMDSLEEEKDLTIEFYKSAIDEGGIDVDRRFGAYRRWDENGGYPRQSTLIGENDELNFIDDDGSLKPLKMIIRQGKNFHVDDFRKFDNGLIELRKGESFARISVVEGDNGYKKVKVENRHSRVTETMAPVIIWQTDKQTGRRSYYRGKFDEFPKHDTLLGQLVVSAYSPQVRDQMPLEIKMKGADGGQRIQPMLEAQTVILVPMFANKFLTQSPVILGLEALAK